MWVDQAIFTSLSRQGKAGYHVVARSPGVTDSEASSLATWSPSHGALVVDAGNRTSVSFHPLSSGRFALARTCEGGAEYSGRGGRQIYTHALILDPATLRRAHNQPLAIYRDALALGYFRRVADPSERLKPVELGQLHRRRDPNLFAERARELGLNDLDSVKQQLLDGRFVSVPCAGDRITLAECILAQFPGDFALSLSFATSLQPSAVRPFRLLLLSAGGNA